MTVNAGAIPASHWTQSRTIGGGRIVGEGCHFVDLLRFLADAPIVDAEATAIGAPDATGPRDSAVLRLRFGNGSVGTVHYLANGHKAVPKERLEVTCAGRVLQLDNFRKLTGHGWPGFSSARAWRQDKGQAACVAAFAAAVASGAPAPIPLDQLLEVSAASIRLQEQLDA